MVKEIIDLIEKNQKIGLFHHVNTDGDSMSCSYGLLQAIKQKYPEKEVYLIGDEKDILKNLPYLDLDLSILRTEIDSSFLAIVGDVAVKERVALFDQYEKAGTKICFDHHRNTINFDADVYWPEPDYPASSMQAYEIAKGLNIEFNENTSFFLLVGILTDTGNFVYSLANPKPLQYYADLLSNVSDQQMDAFNLRFRGRTKEQIELQKEFLNSAVFDGKVAYVIFDKEKIAKWPNLHYKSMINYIANIENYPIWALAIFEEKDGQEYWRWHFRSNGPKVSEIAQFFGGGGHHRAAGVSLDYQTPIDVVIKKLNEL